MRRPQTGYIFTSFNAYWDEVDKPKTKYPSWAKNYLLIREYSLGIRFYYEIVSPHPDIYYFEMFDKYKKLTSLIDALIIAQDLALNDMYLEKYKLFIVCSFIGRY